MSPSHPGVGGRGARADALGSASSTPSDVGLTALLRQIKQTLCVPAAEYVPAMADAMLLLDRAIQLSYQTDPRWDPAARTRHPAARRVERIERHARKLLNFDGGEGSQMYHASKVYDARKALRAALLERDAEAPVSPARSAAPPITPA